MNHAINISGICLDLCDYLTEVTKQLWLSQVHLGYNNKTTIVWMARTTNTYFSQFWRVGSSRSGSSRFSGWREPLSWFINARLFRRRHVAERERELSGAPIGALIPWPNYLPKAPPPNTITVGVSLQLKIWEDTDIQLIIVVNVSL